MDNRAVLEQALSHLTKRHNEYIRGAGEYSPADFQPWNDSLAEDVEFEVTCSSAPAEGDPARNRPPWDVIGRVHRGKAAVIKAFAADQAELTRWEIGKPLEYFGNGDRYVVLLTERWVVTSDRSKAARADGIAVPWTRAAMVFDLRDGKIVRYTHIADMSGHIAAHLGQPLS